MGRSLLAAQRRTEINTLTKLAPGPGSDEQLLLVQTLGPARQGALIDVPLSPRRPWRRRRSKMSQRWVERQVLHRHARNTGRLAT